jgi:putative ABC transport system substrate-binding protein
MRRREFIKVIVGSTTTWPFTAYAQRADKLPIIGFLGANKPSLLSQWTEAFVQRLRELGWIEGRTVTIEYRWAEGQLDRSPKLVEELVRLKVDVIVTHATANVLAAMRATSTIPIVFAAVADPVGNKIVASLARPGGNVTGLSNEAVDLVGKRIELLQELIPEFRRLAMLAKVDTSSAMLEMQDVKDVASKLGLDLIVSEIRHADEIAAAIEALKGRAQAVYVQSDPLFNFNRTKVSALALGARLPTVTGFTAFVEAGGLMSYGPKFPRLFRRAAEYVDKILRGAKPSDLPVEQPTEFTLTINLNTAKALGVAVPPTLLARADEVIE